MGIIINCLKLTVALTLFQIAIIYFPYLLANRGKRKIIKDLILFKPYDFLLSGIFLFFIALIASPFDNMKTPTGHIFSYYMGNWIFGVIASSYFFILYPYLLKKQHSRFIIAPGLQEKYKEYFNSNIPVYVTANTLSNAFASGFFPANKVIVIGKSLTENLSKDEQFAILCHEQGHHRANDLLKFYGFMAFALLCFVIGRHFFIQFMKYLFPAIDNGLVIGIFGSLYGAVFYCFLFSKLSHKAEYRADNFAAKYAGAENMIRALQNLNVLTGDLLVKGSITHPSLEKRIANIRKNYA